MSLDLKNFDLDNLLNALKDNAKDDIKDFIDLINMKGALDREISLGDINFGITGSTIDAYISFWNKYDDEHNIPIEEREPIKLFIDSPGGSLTDSFTIIDSIEMSKTPVWGIVTGCAYSGGFFSLLACDRRIAYPHASFLFHEGSTGTSSDAGKFRNYADFYSKQLEELKNFTIAHTKMTEEYYKEHQRDDLWLMADEALELGVIDEIMTKGE